MPHNLEHQLHGPRVKVWYASATRNPANLMHVNKSARRATVNIEALSYGGDSIDSSASSKLIIMVGARTTLILITLCGAVFV